MSFMPFLLPRVLPVMEPAARRPLKVRDTALAQGIARALSRTPLTPNQISLLSMLFALCAALCFWQVHARPASTVWLLPAALFIQLRLLCNLFDGMVAVEGGKHTPAGELYNDMPDRVADVLILVAAGYACPLPWGVELGWSAALLAVMTAYVRTLSASIGAPVDFSGPMAKQQRMALLTTACLGGMFEGGLSGSPLYSLTLALAIIILGTLLTLVRRTLTACHFLEQR